VSFDLALLTARERLSCETRNKGRDDAEPNRDTWFLARGTRSDLGTIVIHGFVLHTIVMTLRRDLKRGVLGARIWVNMTFDVGATLLALAGHLGEIGLWAFALDLSGAVADIRAAIYSSAGSYTTSGSDIVLPPQWKLLGRRCHTNLDRRGAGFGGRAHLKLQWRLATSGTLRLLRHEVCGGK
jgi:hypothetical protein